MKKILLLWFFSLMVSFECFSQYLLFHHSRYKEAKYEVGDVLTFRLHGDLAKISMQIKGFKDSVIVFSGYKVRPEEISHLYVDEKTRVFYILRYKYKALLTITGIGFLTLDTVNSGEFRKESATTGGILLAGGILAKNIIGNTIKIKGRKKLVIIGERNI